jgi:Asp-tRNA(Asn)/Glu-tRNA(Gln) amidotransferase A subunit family amidase
MENEELCWMPAADPAQAIAKKKVSPVGLQIVGRRFDDALVLRASAAFEAARPWAQRRPPEAW